MVWRMFIGVWLILAAAACSDSGNQERDPAAPPGEEPFNNVDDRRDAGEPPEPDLDAGIEEPPSDVSGDDASADADDSDAGDATPPSGPFVIDDPGHISDTASQLAQFYDTYGGRDAFPPEHVRAFEALIAAEDDLIRGDLASAGQRVESVFALQPRGDRSWFLGSGTGTGGSNVGHPVAYYGLRMVEQIVAQGDLDVGDTLTMTGVIARCATARRPRLEDLEPEIVEVTLSPAVLADDARRLFLATQLFRRWVKAITGGVSLELRLVVLDECTQIDFTDNGSIIASYPDAQGMLDAVDETLARETDFWWVVAPSGVEGTDSQLGRHIITGGMGLSADGRPLFLSDDLWFVRKPEHMGTGDWTEAELRTYHPQWFQHEFMHHLFRTWPQFGLEDTPHQWFDRNTWPDDFEGIHEADYYTEALNKRLLDASPSLAEGLKAPEVVDADQFELSDFVGEYRREPVQNEWHEVTVTLEGEALRWNNAAGVSWSLQIRDAELWSGSDCPYGESRLVIEAEDGQISALRFNGEPYQRRP